MLTGAGNFLFRYRNAMFPFACVLLFLPGPDPFPTPCWLRRRRHGDRRAGAVHSRGYHWLRYVVTGGRNRRVYAEDLVTDGLYAHTRNPMYLGNLLIMFGLAVASNSWMTIAVAVPLGLFMYASIVAAEEEYLGHVLERRSVLTAGMCRAGGRGSPGLGNTLASMHFRWRRIVREGIRHAIRLGQHSRAHDSLQPVDGRTVERAPAPRARPRTRTAGRCSCVVRRMVPEENAQDRRGLNAAFDGRAGRLSAG